MELVPEATIREQAAAAFRRHETAIRELLPAAAIEHIGATAVPGSLTKGDVDLLVAVPRDDFDEAKRRLGERYAPHYPEEWDPTRASFTEMPHVELPVGVQLVVAGEAEERVFIAWRERLRAEPELLERYNELKARRTADDYDGYTEAKAAFIEATLGESI
jgi:GrpB-like predicted nucleotidyltransferase (UPF0157 family)